MLELYSLVGFVFGGGASLKITPFCRNYHCYKALLLLSCGYSHKANDRMVYLVTFLNKVDKYVLKLQNRVVK